jgi:hypothetical protein
MFGIALRRSAGSMPQNSITYAVDGKQYRGLGHGHGELPARVCD